MAYYAHISNEQYTVADRARLEEARGEKDVIETANRASDEYATLKTAYQDSFTSETLEGLQSDLNALYPDIDSEPAQEDIDAINDAIAAEKAVLAAAKESALADMKTKEAEGTEALVTEMAALETSIANTPYIVTHVATGVDEIKYVSGDSSAQNEQVRVLEESKKDIEYNPIEDEYPAELQEIDDQIQALIEEIRNIPQVAVDDTLYWEGWYRHQAGVQAVRRMSYNTQGGVHKLGGTPFRKNYAGVGYMYDPVRDAFYTAQPYPSWTINEDTCYWEAPTPRPEGMDWHWNEPTLEWIDKPGVKLYASWIYNEEKNTFEPPVALPEDGNGYYWNEEIMNWEEL
jgi:vacuolar-type H+-ATPase subunit I/STV1